MKCDCLKTITKNLAEHMKPQAGDDVEVECQGTALQVADGTLKQVIVIPFAIRGSKKGFTSAKGKIMNCSASYCPFCGGYEKQPEGFL